MRNYNTQTYPKIIDSDYFTGPDGFATIGTGQSDNSGIKVFIDFVSGKVHSNGQVYPDLIIASNTNPEVPSSYSGKITVIFGGPGLFTSGKFYLNQINGTNGFVITSNVQDDAFGTDLALGRFSKHKTDNDANFSDLLIGAPGKHDGASNHQGNAYLIKGGPELLAQVNGRYTIDMQEFVNTNIGIRILGHQPLLHNHFGDNVENGGDVFDDGYESFIVGDSSYNQDIPGLLSQYYLHKGGPNLLSGNVINLDNCPHANCIVINPEYIHTVPLGNRFIIDGKQSIGFASGWANNQAGAIHFVPAPAFSTAPGGILSLVNYPGRVMVFGTEVGAGLVWADGSGDFNGDGIKDFVFGEPNVQQSGFSQGRSYVVFGRKNFNSEGFPNLTQLNGLNGFPINNDSIFGRSLGVGVKFISDLQTDGDGKDEILVFDSSDVTTGTYEGSGRLLFSSSNLPIKSYVNASEITGNHGIVWYGRGGQTFMGVGKNHGDDGVAYGDLRGNGYLTICAGGYHGSDLNPSTVVCINENKIDLTHSTLILEENDSLVSSYVLNTTSNAYKPKEIFYEVQEQMKGSFSLNGYLTTNFTQQDVNNRLVRYMQIGNDDLHNIEMKCTLGNPSIDGGYPSESFTIDARIDNRKPTLLKNKIVITEGMSIILSDNELDAIDVDNSDNELSFIITGRPYGSFAYLDQAGLMINSFTLQSVRAGNVLYIHDGSKNAPEYDVVVSDGRMKSDSTQVTTTFLEKNNPPKVIKEPSRLVVMAGENFSRDIHPSIIFGDPEGQDITTSLRFANGSEITPLLDYNGTLFGRIDESGLYDFNLKGCDPENQCSTANLTLYAEQKQENKPAQQPFFSRENTFPVLLVIGFSLGAAVVTGLCFLFFCWHCYRKRIFKSYQRTQDLGFEETAIGVSPDESHSTIYTIPTNFKKTLEDIFTSISISNEREQGLFNHNPDVRGVPHIPMPPSLPLHENSRIDSLISKVIYRSIEAKLETIKENGSAYSRFSSDSEEDIGDINLQIIPQFTISMEGLEELICAEPDFSEIDQESIVSEVQDYFSRLQTYVESIDTVASTGNRNRIEIRDVLLKSLQSVYAKLVVSKIRGLINSSPDLTAKSTEIDWIAVEEKILTEISTLESFHNADTRLKLIGAVNEYLTDKRTAVSEHSEEDWSKHSVISEKPGLA